MTDLLIIAHGSRNPQAIDELRETATRVGELAEGKIGQAKVAFLNHGTPDVPTGLREIARGGADLVYVLPYFLNTGVHVARDLPDLVADARREFSDTKFELLPHIGSLPEMPRLILGMLPDSV